MQTQEVRQKFLNYFKEKKHRVISSASVVPHDDPTLLFNNAGMNQFKDVFLGKGSRDYTRAVSCQKSIRVGGKHNDLENVGHTRRHLTFFEMLGNFSFGDYFKKEAIEFSWELTTEIFSLNPEKIWATVFREDDEAFELWKTYLPEERIVRFDEKDNFWSMGDTGPCGPCSELLYDRGEQYGLAEHPYEDRDGERFLEFWNLVFMQFNRDESGSFSPLPNPCIDTGAGLERVVGLLMDVRSVFQTDILRSLIAQVEEVFGIKYDIADEQRAPAFHIIADHLRSLSFAIVDGAQPSNIDRGYVLRKILRRAVRYGRFLGMEEPFLAKIYPRLIATMGQDYPELKIAENRVTEILTSEEESFNRTLCRGGNIMGQIIDSAQAHEKRISGDDAFKLKDTYGFPLEEILLIAKDTGLCVDLDRYKELEREAKERSRSAHKTVKQEVGENIFASHVKEHGECEFLGYETCIGEGKVIALVLDGEFVNSLEMGQEAMVIVDKTPYYAEMGGQVGDTGILKGKESFFEVCNCQAPFPGIIAHEGALKEGRLSVGDCVQLEVDDLRRKKIASNHTATHLLHWALREVLGEHICQAGSVVDSERLRFDFSHYKSLSEKEIRKIEDLVNGKIRENTPVSTYELFYEEVQKQKEIKQFFGDKYSKEVRVVDIDYSKELCGGTHVVSVGKIGFFRITKEGSIAAGVRRIEAATGAEAEAFSRKSDDRLLEIAQLLKSRPNKLLDRISKLLEEKQLMAKELKKVKKERLSSLILSLKKEVVTIKGTPILISEVPIEIEELRSFSHSLMNELKSAVVVLAASLKDKCNILIQVSLDLQEKGISANEIIKEAAPIIGGGGGGKSDIAQAGGKYPEKLSEAFAKIRDLFEVQC